MLAVQNRRPEFGSPVSEERPGVAVYVNPVRGVRDRTTVRAYCPASLTKFVRTEFSEKLSQKRRGGENI